ncbi:radical SAM protein, partial [Patescibacteria group bacterium]|nr:radical SAM protein [Patescibacteria group bacterium]
MKKDYSKIVVLSEWFALKGSVSDRSLFSLGDMKKYSIDSEQYDFLKALDGGRSLLEILKEYDSVSQKVAEEFVKKLVALGAVRFVEEKRPRFFPDLVSDPHLRSVHFEMTKDCNMRCRHCYQESYMVGAQNTDLTFNEIVNLAEEMRLLSVEKIGVSGGEPFMRDDLFDLLSVFEEKEIAISSILTNGLRLDRVAINKIKRLRSKFPVFVSLDGLNPLAMRLRGIRASRCKVTFRDIVENIKETIESDIPVVINTAVTKENVRDLVEMYDWFRRLGVYGWRAALPKMAGAYVKNHAAFSVDRERAFEAYLAVINRHLETGGIESGFELQIE